MKEINNSNMKMQESVNVPAFLGKLWKMVNDPSTDHLISWSTAGNSFIIQNQALFWYELLPLYYKHNNMSSFVRQLNMYGFHKMSTVENGTMDADKDEIQFFHPYFQKDKPELLVNIKRKVTTTKAGDGSTHSTVKGEDLAKVLTDVKNLRGRQSSVDSQLAEMKQENAVLWRELALLRQKHMKQQQIVNKLIQFLVTLVQPSASARMGVGVKRRMPLMLHESPSKKTKVKKANTNNAEGGPTIHELDSELDMNPELFEEDEIEVQPMVNSPLTPATSTSSQSKEVNSPQSSSALLDEVNADANAITTELLLDKPDFVYIDQDPVPDLIANEQLPEYNLNNLNIETQNNEKIFLNPSTRDTLLSNLINGSYNSNVINANKGQASASKKITPTVVSEKQQQSTVVDTATLDTPAVDTANVVTSVNAPAGTQDMTVATRDPRINTVTLGTNECYREDLDDHLDSMQTEIDQLKDILNGYNSFDANALLGLFNEDVPAYGLMYNQNREEGVIDSADPLVSGSELATTGNIIDFNELFDDSLDSHEIELPVTTESTVESNQSITTPQIVKAEPRSPPLRKISHF